MNEHQAVFYSHQEAALSTLNCREEERAARALSLSLFTSMRMQLDATQVWALPLYGLLVTGLCVYEVAVCIHH